MLTGKWVKKFEQFKFIATCIFGTCRFQITCFIHIDISQMCMLEKFDYDMEIQFIYVYKNCFIC